MVRPDLVVTGSFGNGLCGTNSRFELPGSSLDSVVSSPLFKRSLLFLLYSCAFDSTM